MSWLFKDPVVIMKEIMSWLFKDPINSGLAQFDHAFFLVQTIIITFIYLLTLFIV